jgi:hypothetical protein
MDLPHMGADHTMRICLALLIVVLPLQSAPAERPIRTFSQPYLKKSDHYLNKWHYSGLSFFESLLDEMRDFQAAMLALIRWMSIRFAQNVWGTHAFYH